jgi:hypothetical protein
MSDPMSAPETQPGQPAQPVRRELERLAEAPQIGLLHQVFGLVERWRRRRPAAPPGGTNSAPPGPAERAVAVKSLEAAPSAASGIWSRSASG